jgi:spore maturation protein CgeB
MFSRRIFELMASGTPVVSTFAKGIENLIESGIVWMVHDQKEADEAIHTLMTDDAEWQRRSLAGIREVFDKHTYAHRLNMIFDRIGIDYHVPTSQKFTDRDKRESLKPKTCHVPFLAEAKHTGRRA